MNKKILIGVGAVVLIASGGLYLDSLDRNRGYVDPLDEPVTLPSEFVLAPIGGGKFNVGEEIVAGFTMTYTGDHEQKGEEGSRFFVDEATVFATSNSKAVSPYGKDIVSVLGTATLDGETMTFDLTGYKCVKADWVSIVFTNILTRYDLAGVPQKDNINDRDMYWGGDVHVSVECVEEGEMVQIEPPRVSFPAGQSPLGANEAETGYLHEDGHRYYNGERVNSEGIILDDLDNE